MSQALRVDAPAVALAGAGSLVDDLFAADLTLGTDDELLSCLRDLERLSRRLVAVGHSLIAEAQDSLPAALAACRTRWGRRRWRCCSVSCCACTRGGPGPGPGRGGGGT